MALHIRIQQQELDSYNWIRIIGFVYPQVTVTSESHQLGRDAARLQATPYTLNFTPYTLNSTPYTLHPTHYTLHPKPYTLNSTP